MGDLVGEFVDLLGENDGATESPSDVGEVLGTCVGDVGLKVGFTTGLAVGVKVGFRVLREGEVVGPNDP